MRLIFLVPVFVLVSLIIILGLPMTGFFGYQVGFVCRDCNVVIFTVDTLRADHLSSYGYFEETSPVIDSLARDGVVFTNAFSQIPHTPPSHWSIFTGLYPHKHNMFLPSDNGTGLVTLSYMLRENGYVTSAYTSSNILNGFKDEFDYFNEYIDKNVLKRIMRRAENTTQGVLSWLDNHSHEKFFMWVHYYDPHTPYRPPDEYDTYNHNDSDFYSDARNDQLGLSKKTTIREDIAKYDGEVRYLDEYIGVVLDKIKELGLERNTLIVFLSDHGECFGEHNFSDFGYKMNKPCLFHGKTLYDEEIHIPFIIVNPKSKINNLVLEEIVETVDLAPTILDVLGMESYGMDGKTLLPLIEDGEWDKGYTISQTRPKKNGALAIALRSKEWKFVSMVPTKIELEKEIAEQAGESVEFTDEQISGQVRKLLFKVSEDETKNHYDRERDIADALEEQLRGLFSGNTFPQTWDIDTDTEKILKSLGYVT